MKYLADAEVGSYVEYLPQLNKAVVPKTMTGYFTDQYYNPEKVDSWRVFKENARYDTELVCANNAIGLTMYGEQGCNSVAKAIMAVCGHIAFDYDRMFSSAKRVYGRSIGCTYHGEYDLDMLMDDVKRLRDNDLMVNTEWIWVPVVECITSGKRKEYAVKTLHISGYLTDVKTLYSVDENGKKVEDFHTCGVLPIISMPSAAMIVEGDGSKDKPYKLAW